MYIFARQKNQKYNGNDKKKNQENQVSENNIRGGRGDSEENRVLQQRHTADSEEEKQGPETQAGDGTLQQDPVPPLTARGELPERPADTIEAAIRRQKNQQHSIPHEKAASSRKSFFKEFKESIEGGEK